MSLEKLLDVSPRTEAAHRLQRVLVAYHHFRQDKISHPCYPDLPTLSAWQIERLKTTHRDLYSDPAYHTALHFLIDELYAPKDFSQRDADLERVFPKMVKLLPDAVLDLVADLVELNHLTQKLDLDLLSRLTAETGIDTLDALTWAQAYRACDNRPLREQQLRLIHDAGVALERYVHSHVLRWTLSATRGLAESKGLGELHQFLQRGFEAFSTLQNVPVLLDEIQRRETAIMVHLFEGDPAPDWPQRPHAPDSGIRLQAPELHPDAG